MTGTARALARLGAPLRGWPAAARLLGGAGCAVGALALAAWGARLGWVDGATWVALAWGAALAALGLAAALAVRATRRGGPAAVARWLEESGRWRRGALAGLLGDAAPGTSGELFAAADGAAERTLRTEGPVLLAARVATARRAAARGAGVLLLAAAGLAAARPTSGRAALLWQPRAAWREATAPFRLRGPDAAVPRGAPVTLELTAPGRRRAILWLRAPGETWRGVAVALDSAGRGRYQTAPLESDLFARFTAGGRGSDTLAIHVLLPAFVGQVTVTAHYPAYLRLDPEPLPLDGDTILLPLGARLVTAGEATAKLGAAAWVGPRGPAPLAVRGATFRGAFEPRGAGSWRLDLTTADGAPLAGEAVTLPVRVVADSAPEVAIPVPGVDTLIPIDLRLPLVIEARDDHGLARLTVESERLAAGAPAGAVRQEVPLEQGLPDHAVVPLVLDLTDRGLLPGDSVRVVVQAEDAAPVAHRARSRAYLFRLARPDELRAAARAASAAIGTALDSAAARSRRLERATGDLAQERDRAASGGNDAADQALDYDAARRAEQVAHDQQEMLAQAEALRRQVEELQRAAEASGASDPEWQRQLEEIRRELDRALTPELRERLAGLQRALADLDAERAREALKDLTAEQQRLREALERSRELFRRAAVEGDLANLAAEARDLERAQQRWNETQPRADSAQAARLERELARRADSLAAGVERLGEQLGAEGRQAPLQRTAEQAAEAARTMRDAADRAAAGERPEAAEAGTRAAEQLAAVPEDLNAQRDALQRQWRSEVTAELDEAMQEIARLGQSQLEVAQGFRRGESPAALRQQQGSVEEGTRRVLERVREAAGSNALVSPQLAANLAMAEGQMRRAREAVSSAQPNLREGGDRAEAAVDALNAVAQQLLQSSGDVNGAQSGSGLAEAMARMSELAQQQGAVGQGAQALLPLPGQGRGTAQLQALAAEQRAIAERLARVQAGGALPGAGQLADEARDLARRLEAGRLDRATAERQERLFRRMLDAGRTLQGEQEDPQKERQSVTATGDAVQLPPALRARLADADGRLRMPGWDELQRFAPEERRLVVDYFRRLAERRP